MPTNTALKKPRPAQKTLPTAASGVKAPAAAATVAPPADDLKVVRDGFTMPQADYDLLKTLKAQCLDAGVAVKKSELLRAGVQALAALPAKALIERMRALPAVKAGRKKYKD